MDSSEGHSEAAISMQTSTLLPLLSPMPLKRIHSDSSSAQPVKHPHFACSSHFPATQSLEKTNSCTSSDTASRNVADSSRPIESHSGTNSADSPSSDSSSRQPEPARRSASDEDVELAAFRKIIQDRMLSPDYDKQWTEDCQCFDTLKFVKLAAEKVEPVEGVILPNKTGKGRLLIFDLDNTLVYCSPSVEGAQHKIQVMLPTGKAVSAGIRIRPFAKECLRLANQFFEVAVFTASHSCYSDQVIDLLDPDHVYVQHRLFRENCLLLNSKYLVKDLRVIHNYDLKDVIIVENCILSYGLQLYNGVPVPTWSGESGDSHLKALMRYFRALSECADVRDLNRQVFEAYYCCLTDEDV